MSLINCRAIMNEARYRMPLAKLKNFADFYNRLNL